MTIEPGKYGWLEFAPIMNRSYGFVRTYDWLGRLKSEKYVNVYVPRRVDGKLDGIIYKVTSYNPPNY